eukprot:scaffold116384_cov53-Attheya_sp.AAC.3
MTVFVRHGRLQSKFGVEAVRVMNKEEEEEIMREMLKEETDHYNDDHYMDSEDQLRQEEAAAEARRSQQEDEQLAAQAEQQRLIREAQFEADLAKMDAAQQKLAKQQKKADAKMVRRILNASQRKNHYGVLGLRNFEIGFQIFHKSIRLFQLQTQKIKGAYRTRAKLVHPDKNRDGRADQAFIALEQSAAILVDDELRADYDHKRSLDRQRFRNNIFQTVGDTVDLTVRHATTVVHLFRRIVGPFATPILVLGTLIA